MLVNAVLWADWHVSWEQLDFNTWSQAQAEAWICRDVLGTDLVPIKSKRQELREVGHIHSAAETTQSEL